MKGHGMRLITATLRTSTRSLSMQEPGSGLVFRQLFDLSLMPAGYRELLGSMGYRFLSLPSHTPSMGFSHLPTLQPLSLSLAFYCSVESKARHRIRALCTATVLQVWVPSCTYD